MVYDNQDRLVASQDALQRQNGGYFSFTHYDKFGRIAAQGQHPEPGVSRISLQAYLNSLGSNNVERTTSSYSHSGLDIFYTRAYGGDQVTSTYTTVNYYDNYQNLSITPSAINGQSVIGVTDTKTKGLAVASFTNVLGTTTWNKNFTFYDTKYIRPIASSSTNYLGGYTNVASNLDFRGKVKNTVTKHKPNDAGLEVTINEGFEYYDNELLKYQTHQINNGAVEYIVQNSYNEINQLTNKKVGNSNSSSPLQNVNYKYNIRGWMTDINNIDVTGDGYNDLFSFRIGYNNLYNGNISSTFWRSAPNERLLGYNYEYDGLNRLLTGTFINYASLNYTYNEYIKGYDYNGNILGITRTGNNPDFYNPIDDLTYDYQGASNKLLAVTNAYNNTSGFSDGNKNGNDYSYDSNGNLTKDLNKGITNITYNFLNLPTEVLWNATQKINYTYDASGVKLKKIVTNGATVTTTDYLGGFQYQNNSLQFFPTAEGYVNVTNGNTFNYVYNYTDHLGNVRVSYQKEVNGTLKVLEENNYYPFGLKHSGYTPLTTGNQNYKYKYNGKELQDELSLNLYDYGARNYDPAIGRWFKVDPLAEKFPGMSPYCAMGNNPIFYIDPDGREIIGATKKDAQNFKADIHLTLADKRFDGVRALIDVKGKTFKSIDAKALSTALDGVTLSADERTYIDMVTNTINSTDIHTVEYVSVNSDLSSSGFSAINSYLNGLQSGYGDALRQRRQGQDGSTEYFYNDQTIKILGGEGFNVPTKKGSHSFITGVTGNERVSTSGHEVFGHGIPSATGASPSDNNANAIRVDNLIRRMLGMPQRDGKNHGGYKEGHITDPQKLPRTQ
nr:RHS repeat-associated core domain-containing protein [Empedobacter falsenii]